MKQQKGLVIAALSAALLAPAAGGCSSRETSSTTTVAPTLAGVLAADPTVSYAAELLSLTQPDAVLRGVSPHTVFVPTNAALDTYARSTGRADGSALVEAVRSDPVGAGGFVSNFVTEGLVTAKDFTENAGETFTTTGGVDVTITVQNGVVKLTTATVTATVTAVDRSVGSTTAHVVDTVLS